MGELAGATEVKVEEAPSPRQDPLRRLRRGAATKQAPNGVRTSVEELPEQMLRAWRVTGRITEPRRRGIAGAATRLVGRERELGLLSTRYHATVRERHPHLAVVVGDPGIGKTRLTAEFVAGVEGPLGGASVYTGRCRPALRGLAIPVPGGPDAEGILQLVREQSDEELDELRLRLVGLDAQPATTA